MIFLPVILLILGITFGYFGRQEGNSVFVAFGVCLVIAAFGTGLITFFALQAINASYGA
jgi:hypothetical protein